MASETHSRVAAQIRQLAAKGRYHGKASELVKLFGVPFTADGVRVVEDALTAKGLATRPPLSADKPKQDVTVVIVADIPNAPQPSDADEGSKAAAGWYDDPEAPEMRRYWDGEAWTDQWSAAETAPTPSPDMIATRTGKVRVWPSGFLLVLGAVGLWFAETYKPTVSNQLGLNGSFYLKPGPYHVIALGSILLLVIGGIRLLMAIGRR